MDIDSSSDSSGDSFLEGPRRLLPSDIADILLEREVEARLEECNRGGDRDSDDPKHNKEDLLVHFKQDTDNNGSSSRLGKNVQIVKICLSQVSCQVDQWGLTSLLVEVDVKRKTSD